MPTFVYRNGSIVPKDQSDVKPWKTMIISDIMDPMKHMASGRIIDSKSRFRAETKATGCIELGNEPIRSRKPIMLDKRQRREDIQRVVFNLRNGTK